MVPYLLVALAGLLLPAYLVLSSLISYRRASRGVESPKQASGAEVLLATSNSPSAASAESQPHPSGVEEEEASPLLDLTDQLAAAFSAEKAAGHTIGLHQPPASRARLDAAVRGLLQRYLAEGNTDWKDYVHWNDHHYVRNLVYDCDDFELMVICWRYGQGSRVHNHAESHCWLTVLQGCVHEHQYKMPGGEEEAVAGAATPAEPPALPGVLAASAPCPKLRHIGTHELQAGETGYINDSLALHAVRVPEHCEGQGAVTLHLYAPPIRRVKLYEPDNNRVVQRQPGFFTVGLGRNKKRQQQAAAQLTIAAAGAAPPAPAGKAPEAPPLMWEI